MTYQPQYKVIQIDWVHYCQPPVISSDGLQTPSLPAGQAWFCGCGQCWGSTGHDWIPVEVERIVTNRSQPKGANDAGRPDQADHQQPPVPGP